MRTVGIKRARCLAVASLLLAMALGAGVEPAASKGPGTMAARIDRGWFLPGDYFVPAVAYDGSGGVPSLLALDTVAGRMTWVDLPQLKERRSLFLTKMQPKDGGRQLALFNRTFATRYLTRPGGLLGFARTPRRPGNLLLRQGVVGRSVEGRPITLRQYGDPAWSGELLVFGCIHGDECAARGIRPLTGGRPDPGADIHLVPNLNPDGGAAGTRQNSRGVDLNRNFPSEWRRIGSRGDPEYSGPRPFSEPETRLAARIIRRLRPEATIWFHQFRGEHPFVRAWGPSVAAGRRFAGLAGLPFRRMRWPAGTAPNWQNHRFRGDASFVVELPRGQIEPKMRDRLSKALVRMGRWVREG